jgi:general nucleoside transport system ATP-binding protein
MPARSQISHHPARPPHDNGGAAVRLISEDLDELLELADRITVMFNGKLTCEAATSGADGTVIDRHMAGH